MDFTNLQSPHAWLGLAILLALGAVVYFIALSAFTLFRLRHPHRRTYSYAVARNIPGDPSEITPNPAAFEEWEFPAVAGSIEVWDVRGDAPGGPTVIVTHGWGSCRIDMLSRFSALRPHASRVLFWDMRAHGESPGACTLGVREPDDLKRLVSLLSEEDGQCRVVLFGYSLGAEVTVRTVASLGSKARSAIVGVLLEAPYRRGITPARAVLRASQFPSVVNLPIAMVAGSIRSGAHPFDRWRDLTRFTENFGESKTPLLVLHGEGDSISPAEDGRAFAEACGGSVVEVPGAGHKDLFDQGRPVRPEIAGALDAFFSGARRASASPRAAAAGS